MSTDPGEELRRMPTSLLVRAIATHEAMAVTEKILLKMTGGSPSLHGQRSAEIIAHYAAELDARLAPRG